MTAPNTRQNAPITRAGVPRVASTVGRYVLLVLLVGASTGTAGEAHLRLGIEAPLAAVQPLDLVPVHAGGGTVSVLDGRGREYVRMPATEGASFRVGGAAGIQTVRLLDDSGAVLDSVALGLEPRTAISEPSGRIEGLLEMLKASMAEWEEGMPRGIGDVQWRGRTRRYYVHWIRDHVHTLKGMKYFDGSGAEILDVFRDAQRGDGMIFDFFGASQPPGNFYDTAYAPLGYVQWLDGLQFVRMPVEADVEYLFVEGLYFGWKMTGDDAWMAGQLEAAVRALDYSARDPARWSRAFGLVKRGYTIDTWDYQIDDAWTSLFPRWGTLLIDPARTKFGIMFGDNTGYAASCGYLAEMLERVGRPGDARRFRERAAAVRKRLDEASWQGTHFRHWVPEDPDIVRDVGVDERAQVSLSNSYSLNRGISREQAAAIIRTYQGIRDALPAGSPGEWYGIYPPFEKGFSGHSEPWQYVNGGVSPIIAGELARGAFVHGFEEYGADILDRVRALGEAHGRRVRFAYTGAYPAVPVPRYSTIDLASHATMDLASTGAAGVPGWMATMPDDDLSNLPTGDRVLADVPFHITDPSTNGRRAVVAVSHRKGFPERVEIPIGRKAGAIYVLHTTGDNGNTRLAGAIAFVYEDGTDATQYVVRDGNVAHWWYPALGGSWPPGFGQPRLPPLVRLAWSGRNDACPSIGIYWYGVDNPHPERTLKSVVFSSTLDGAIYAVLGLTLSDQPLHQRAPEISYGGPDNWAAAAVVYALVEGLAGVVDEDVAYRVAAVAPRWPSAGVAEARAVVHYPASDGYVAYHYRHEPGAREILLTLTGSGDRAAVHVLLPKGATSAAVVTEEGETITARSSRVEASTYTDFTLELPAARRVRIRYQ